VAGVPEAGALYRMARFLAEQHSRRGTSMRAIDILVSTLACLSLSCAARADVIEIAVTGTTWSGGGSGTYFNGSGSAAVPDGVPMTVKFTLDTTQLDPLRAYNAGGNGETYYNIAGAGGCTGISLPQVPLQGDYVAAASTLSGTAPFSRALGGQSGGNLRNCDYVSLDDNQAGGDGVVVKQDAYSSPIVYYVDGDLTTVSPTPTLFYRQETRVHAATLNGIFDGNPFSTDELLTDLVGSFTLNATWGASVRVQFSRSVYQCWNPGGSGYLCQNMPLEAWDQYDVMSIATSVVGVKVGGYDLAALTLTKNEVPGCKPVTGKVTLTGPAPAGGVIVALSDSLPATTLPATVTVPAGATYKTFTIASLPVSAKQAGNVSATAGTITKVQALAVRPMGMLSLTLSPTTVVGGIKSTGTAKLECAAAPGPITVNLSSSAPAVAAPVAASVVVPQGSSSVTFDVATSVVLARSTASVSGVANSISKSRTLTVTPRASVTPTSLKFGSLATGATSAPLVATLSNKGNQSFVVNSVALTGTYAATFTMTHDCPGTLAAGASCSISVQFKPTVAASRSAKVTITTSATTSPLSVALSGTGI
jgi:hypothetical protein